MKYISQLFCLIGLFFGFTLIGQEEGANNWLGIEYGVSSGKYQPFWLRSNQYGTIPTKGAFMQVGTGYSQEYKKNSKRIKFGYGAEVRFLVGTDKSAILFPELYAKSKFGIFEIWGGMRRKIYGLADSTLSSGSFVWSGNALPMPKVELTVPNWYYPGFMGGFFAFKGSFAHGWFENNREDISHFYLHQKSFYGQFGKKDAKVKLFGGFNHQVQWGGKLLYPDPQNNIGINGVIPSTFRDYFYVVTGFTLASVGDTTRNGKNDAWNRAGNHLGSVDIGAEITIGKVKILGYRQSYYEDGSLYYGNNITDGLHGISIQNTSKGAFRKIVFEYFNTTSQGGDSKGYDGSDPSILGQDNYFNNSAYNNGWTYRKMSIGNPFMTLDSETDLNPTDKTYFDNNRIEAFYVASEWNIGKANVIVKGSLANAIGAYGSEYIPVKKMYSVAVFLQKPVQIMGYNATFKGRVGYDQSQWYASTFGIHAGLSMPLY